MKRIVREVSVCLGLAICAVGAAAQPTRESAPPPPNGAKGKDAAALTPQQRLEASIEAYRKAKTYRDEGTVTFSRIENGKENADKDVLRFRTAFERGGRFRFQFEFRRDPQTRMWEWGEANSTFTIWSKDGKKFSCLESPGDAQIDEDKVATHLASAMGISAGAASMVLPWLQIDQGKSSALSLINLTAPKDAGRETIAGVECWKITGAAGLRGTTATLWIGEDCLMLCPEPGATGDACGAYKVA